MGITFYIMCFVIATVLVVVKLMLEHQRDQDRANGNIQDDDSYTMKGMLRLIREENREKRTARREERHRAKIVKPASKEKSHVETSHSIKVKRFQHADRKNQE